MEFSGNASRAKSMTTSMACKFGEEELAVEYRLYWCFVCPRIDCWELFVQELVVSCAGCRNHVHLSQIDIPWQIVGSKYTEIFCLIKEI